MGHSWSSQSRQHPSRGQQQGDLEQASFSEEKLEQSAESESSEDSSRKERYSSLSALEYDKLVESEKTKIRQHDKNKLNEEVETLRVKDGSKIDDYGDAIQPHTDDGGDAYFFGDAYTPINNTFAEEWAVPNPGPYLQYVKQIAKTWTHLEYLGHWMEVTCAPPKWKFLRRDKTEKSRLERAARTKACVIDYTNGSVETPVTFEDATKLKKALEYRPQSTKSRQARLIVIEDLSRDLIEALGGFYDIDPLFFASHIGDYLFHNTRDRWVELPTLDVDARKMPHFCLSYLRARYFETEDDFHQAEFQTGKFNVLRRLDSDRSRKRLQKSLLDLKDASVALSRAKTSFWMKPRKEGEPVTAILLVDPTVDTKHSHPLWGGYRPFTQTPSMSEWHENPQQLFDAPERQSLFDDVVYWSKRLTPGDLEMVDKDPRCIALSMFKIVVADWLVVLKYMTTMLGKMEWEFETPHWGDHPQEIDGLLKKLSPWRRNVGYYETMISEATARLFPPEIRAPLHASAPIGASFDASSTWATAHSDSGIRSLWTDFQNLKRQMDSIQARIKSIEQTATNAINIEESRRSVKQNKNLARLTFLATIFIPLNFTSSFLSVSPDFPKAHQTIWLFFAIGVPLTCLALLVVDLSHPEGNGFCMRKIRHLQGKEEKIDKKKEKEESRSGATASPASSSGRATPPLLSKKTIPWPPRRFETFKP